jgi:HEPN domain-containing protein
LRIRLTNTAWCYMRTPEQVKWDFVQQWLNRARKDLAAGELLLKGAFEDYENVGFHAQQAAEKFIKAFLVCHQIELSKTDDIALLRQLVASVDPELAKKLAGADALTPYGVESKISKPPSNNSRKSQRIWMCEPAARSNQNQV